MPVFVKKTQPTSPLQYLFRMPTYPVLCHIEGYVFSAKSENQLIRRLAQYVFKPEGRYEVIDATGEHWTFYPDTQLLSPLNMRKRWTKLQLIRLVNARSNKSNLSEPPYSERSLSSKRFERIFHDLVSITNVDRSGAQGAQELEVQDE